MSIGSARNTYNLNIEGYHFGFGEYRSYWACFTQTDISFVAAHFEAALLNRLSYFNFY
jgi:hypothetical protein